MIIENQISNFAYKEYVSLMTKQNYAEREESFRIIRNAMRNKLFCEMKFTQQEKNVYASFAKSISEAISEISNDCRYLTDSDKMIRSLENVYRKNMLEDYIQNNSSILSCFLDGAYSYRTSQKFKVEVLQNFIDWFKSCSSDKRNIILANLTSRLDAADHYDEKKRFDEIPF